MRRLLLPLLVGALLAPTAPALADHVTARPVTTACPDNQVSTGVFADVAAASPFELAISCLADYGITRGRTPTSYAPAGSVLRQQMAQFLFRLGSRAGIDWDTSEAGFQDLGGIPAEAREAINALANGGVAQGRSAAVFDPAGFVTRGQMASFLARLADAARADGFAPRGDAFDDDEDLIHEANIDRIAAAGVTAGRGSDRSFDPLSAVTREQMAAFLARTLDVLVDQDLAASRYRDDVAAVSVALDQQGALVEPASALTGRVTGNRLRSATLTSPCAGTVGVGREFSVPTDPQSPTGRCPVTVEVTFDNGRSRPVDLFVVMPGLTALPELVHVERVSTSDAGGHDTSEVRFVFDSAVVPSTDFGPVPPLLLRQYGDSHAPVSVRQESARVLLATYGTAKRPVGAEELRAVSFASAHRGAVVDPEGRPGPASSALLDPRSSSATAYAGPTWNADLLSVTEKRPDPDRQGGFLVDFVFDARLPLRNPADFGADREYAFDVGLTDGTGRRCSPQSSLPRRRVTVSCPGPDGEVARGVLSQVLSDTEAPLASSLLTHRPTPAPDLVQAEWGPAPGQATFTFDEPVHLRDPRRFRTEGPHAAFGGSGQRAEVSSADPRRVVVTLAGDGLDRNALAAARGGAVTSRATGQANSFAQVRVPVRNPAVLPAGQTLDTDLLRLTVSPDAVAYYDFDTFFFPDETGRLYGDLRLYTREGLEMHSESAGYGERDASQYSTDLVSGFFEVTDPDGTTREATREEIRAAVYGSGLDRLGRPVDGARR